MTVDPPPYKQEQAVETTPCAAVTSEAITAAFPVVVAALFLRAGVGAVTYVGTVTVTVNKKIGSVLVLDVVTVVATRMGQFGFMCGIANQFRPQ